VLAHNAAAALLLAVLMGMGLRRPRHAAPW